MSTAWSDLHAQPRHQLRYPSEHVVRFLAGVPHGGKALDIGCGYGRHLRLARSLGFAEYGVDSSSVVDQVASAKYGLMTNLPYGDEMFDVVLAYGVFYYGTREQGQQAVNEMHRVMKPGGHGFVSVRSIHDWRAEGIPVGEPEYGMEMHFLSRDQITKTYAAFSDRVVEMTSTSRAGRWDSDWLIRVTK